ncbi:hypothetical protein NVP1055O_53 [Vibrio phage 1.055.O._10N.286.55.E9]|nr:hypothetical protein NVP1055O_53 [Vibrio phage 1.055.O._10N.286.55.E9]
MSELVTLFIAWQIARVSGLNQAAAISKSARRLRDKTDDKNMRELFILLSSDISDADKIKCINAMYKKYESEVSDES